jgi:hypothetical protein
VLADYGIYWVLRYVRDEGGVRRDVRLLELTASTDHVLVALEQVDEERNVFIADTNEYYDVERLEEVFRIVQKGAAYELVPR